MSARTTRRRGHLVRRFERWAGVVALALAIAAVGAVAWARLAGAGDASRAVLAVGAAARGAASSADARGTGATLAKAAQAAPLASTPPAADAPAADAGEAADRSAAPPSLPAHPHTDRQRLLAAAYALRGVPYKWGGKTASALDCSGFTKLAYAKIGVSLPDGSFNQEGRAHRLRSAAQLKPGDLVFYRWQAGKSVGHVTMYFGDGWLIGTGSPGQVPEVTVFPLADDMVSDGRVLTYRHIVLADER